MNNEKKSLSPRLSLSDIYGNQQVLIPRPSLTKFGWLINNQVFNDFSTGAPLTIAGDMPVVCSHYVSNEENLNLLKMADLPVATNRKIYHTSQDFTKIMDTLVQQKQSLVFNHLYPPEEVVDTAYWISPQLLALLNNKAHMKQLVPAKHLAKRMVIHPSEILQLSYRDLPVVIKVGSEKPSGGGRGLIICTRKEHLFLAYQFFADCQTVVVEELLQVRKNYCVQFARTFKGETHYLGTTEQITNAGGIYVGSWLGREVQPPEEVITLGRKIMDKACSMGYRGIGGFDIVTTNDRRVLAIDLNFRLNGSTPALLLQNSIVKQCGFSTLLFRYWSFKTPYDRVYSRCKKAIAEGYFIPLYLYNPLLPSNANPVTQLSGLLLGSSRKDIKERVAPMFQKFLNS